jgi:hypothetical protein
LAKRVLTIARRLAAAAQHIASRPAAKSSPGSVPTGDVEEGHQRLYPGLPNAALRQAVEASIEGVSLSKRHLTRFAMYKQLTDQLASEDRLSRAADPRT